MQVSQSPVQSVVTPIRIPDSDEQTFNNTLDNFIMSIDLAREQLNIQSQPSSTPQSIAQLA